MPRLRRKDRKVAIIAPFFHYYPIVAPAMACQRHKNWELYLIHDGPCPNLYKEMLSSLLLAEPRIKFIEIEKCKGQWGHEIRQRMIEKIGKGDLSPDCNYIVVTNGDNYHSPAYLDQLVTGFHNDKVVAVYHELLAHNYIGWQILPPRNDGKRLALGHIDVAQMMVRKDVAYEIGWKDMSHSSDWTYMKGIIQKYGEDKVVMMPGCHAIHN